MSTGMCLHMWSPFTKSVFVLAYMNLHWLVYNLFLWKLYLEISSETVLGHRSYTLSLPAGLFDPPEGVLFRPPPPPPATPLTLPRLSMTFAPAPPPPREAGTLGFLAPPPVGRDTAFDDGRCSSERRGRTPLRGRLKTNLRLHDLSMTCSIRGRWYYFPSRLLPPM